MESHEVKAVSQYGDLFGTVSADFNDGKNLFDLFENCEKPAGYYPVG